MDEKNLWTIVSAVVVTALVVGGIMYSVQNSKSKNLQKDIDDLKTQVQTGQSQAQNNQEIEDKITGLENQIADLENQSVSPAPTQTAQTQFTAKLISLNPNAFVVQFSKDVNSSTLNSSTVKVWAVGGSIGTEGEKNNISKNYTYNYSKSNKTLNIIANETGICASCTYQIELTNGIKDVGGNNFPPVILK